MVRGLEKTVQCFAGKSVTFTCEINQEDILGKWYKGEKELTNYDPNITITNEGKIHKLIITCVRFDAGGDYTFKIKGKRSTSHLKVLVDIIRHLEKNVQCIEADNVTLTCEVNEDIPGKWFKNEDFKSTTEGKIHKLEIPSATIDDTATYSLKIGDSVSSTQLTVLKVDVLRHLEENVECNEGGRVTFTCELNHKDIPGKWFRNDKELSPSDSKSFKVDGKLHELIICNVKFDDRGYYSLYIRDKPVSSSTLTVLEPVTPEEVNYLRLIYLLETEAESVVRGIFDREFHPTQLKKTLDQNKTGKLSRLKQQKHINRAEFDVLFPKVVEYSVKFRLRDYDISMVRDQTEKEKLEKEIETAVTTLYSAVKGIQTIKVQCFQPGSLVVVLTLTSKQFYDKGILQSTIKSAVNGGMIESFVTERNGFSFEMLGSK
ncbi:TTN [Mytilus coruscus]|uniref:TTN n=1 Tax=Mytilus coruscus TaxID=42192 RepID=A0A6J8CLZ3_MYTCO|nr:TTN [Mytilus coruscus]